MKNLFLIATCLFFTFYAYAQKSMKKSELGSDYLLMDVKAEGSKMFAVKYQGACIAYNKKSKEFYLYGDANGTDIIFLEKVISGTFRFYPDKFISSNYKDGKIFIASQITGKATVVTGVFNWNDEHAIFEKEEVYDLSELQVSRAKSLLKIGKTQEALATYDSVQFSDSYFDAKIVGIELLLASKKTIDDFISKRKFKELIWQKKSLHLKAGSGLLKPKMKQT